MYVNKTIFEYKHNKNYNYNADTHTHAHVCLVIIRDVTIDTSFFYFHDKKKTRKYDSCINKSGPQKLRILRPNQNRVGTFYYCCCRWSKLRKPKTFLVVKKSILLFQK